MPDYGVLSVDGHQSVFWLRDLHQRIVSSLVFTDGYVIFEVLSGGQMVLIANHDLSFLLYVIRLELGLVIGVSILRGTGEESEMIMVDSFLVLFVKIVAIFSSVMFLY